MRKHERATLGKIRPYAEQAMQSKEGMAFDEFSDDSKTIAACVFSLSQIGELVTRLDSEFLKANSQIPWPITQPHSSS